MTTIDWIAGPLSYPFMQRALGVSLLVAAVCAVLSCYLVLKGWSLMGDAISHAVLPGIVIAYVLGVPLAIGAFAAGLRVLRQAARTGLGCRADRRRVGVADGAARIRPVRRAGR